jgi:ribosomal protein S18 acetylase RimI-like enzyme
LRVYADVMLAPATAPHFERISALIRQGAREHAFEPALAEASAESDLFFANLRQALTVGTFVEEQQGALVRRATAGYVYLQEPPTLGPPPTSPLGFGLFKAFANWGYELWLMGVDVSARGRRYGRAMLEQLLETPAGRMAYTVRVRRDGGSADRMDRLLLTHGYTVARESPASRWYLRADAPQDLARLMRSVPIGGRSESR